MLSALMALCLYLIQGWYTDVNHKLEGASLDHTNLQVLSTQVRHVVESQAQIIEQLQRINDKLNERKVK